MGRRRAGSTAPLSRRSGADDADAQVAARRATRASTWMVCVGTDLATSRAGDRARGAARRRARRPSACTRTTRRSSTPSGTSWTRSRGAERVRRRSARPASTSTTSTRRATSRRRRSGARSGSRTSSASALVIHSRDAWDDTFRVLDDEGVPERTVFHCFTGGPDEARARARPRLLPLVQRHRVVQERRRAARRGARSRPPTGCSSRPTRRTSRRCRTAASRTSPRTSSAVGAALAAARGEDVDEIADASRARTRRTVFGVER